MARLGDLAGFNPISLVDEEDRKDWVQPLQDSCLYYFVEHLPRYCDVVNGRLQLKPELRFPDQFCEELVEYLRQAEPFIPSEQLYLFANTSQTKLFHMNLHHSLVDDNAFEAIIHHNPAELDLIGCERLTTKSLLALKKHAQNLVAFSYGDSSALFDELDLPKDERDRGFMYGQREMMEENPEMQKLTEEGLAMPKLRRLNLQRIPSPKGHRDMYNCKTGAQKVIDWFLAQHTELTHLDITGCSVLFQNWTEMGLMTKLTHLSLHDTSYSSIEDASQIIKQMKELRVLDLSQCSQHQYASPTRILTELVRDLKHLKSLDISGTNLCGDEGSSKCGIPGLEGRQLEYLGLVNAGRGGKACKRKNIPARKVAGWGNADQILLAIEVFRNRPCEMLEKSLDKLRSIVYDSPEDISDRKGCIQLVLRVMKANLHHRKITHSAMLFFSEVAKVMDSGDLILPQGLKRDMLALLVSTVGAELNNEEPWTAQSAMDVMVKRDLPSDLSFISRQTVRRMLPHTGRLRWEYNCHYSLFIVRAMVTDPSMKEWAAKNNLMELMIKHILQITKTDWTYDEIMQKLWNIFWTLTDVCPSNSKRFLDLNGIDVFMEIYRFYKSQPEADGDDRRRKDGATFTRLCGVMGNIVEDESLHPRLMRSDFLEALYDMLNYPAASHGACGTFAYLLKGGQATWTVASPSRADVRARVERIISQRDVHADRSVTYKTFIPMIYLLDCKDSPASQLWAAWELCSMINKDPWHYGLMMKDEGGLDLFKKIISDGTSSPQVLKLAREVVDGFKNAQEEAKRRESRCTIS